MTHDSTTIYSIYWFQLTRSRGAWLHKFCHTTHTWNFNSHAHVERDFINFATQLTLEISTHTLTWSVTSTLALYHAKVGISTHTLTWSVTSDRYYWNYLWQFQLTRSRGAWREWQLETDQRSISTHTLTWSVTVRVLSMSFDKVFQLTRSRGAWPVMSLSVFADFSFQLTRSRGAWRDYNENWILFIKNFNSHAHVERD